MGLIKKKTAIRGNEGGVKYVCDICSSDITATVRIQCVRCTDYDLCVPCFSEGKSSRDHDPPSHPFRVIEQHSIPIFTEDWGADEELMLLEGAETYGLGSWAEIADHIGGHRTKDEVRDHYVKTYIDSPNFPLPLHASPDDRSLIDDIPREIFQARKKRRIEERKQAAKDAPPTAPKQKPTASVPSCHEVQGYMPGRLEFETEYFNEAEEAVQHMQFDPMEVERGPENDPEMDLKMTIFSIYNERLTARVDRKKTIFEHKLLEYKKNQAVDKKRSKEEKDIFNRAKPFARMMNHDDFEELTKSLEYEHNLRQAILQLQDWRIHHVTDLKSGDRYETEKHNRATRTTQFGNLDRLASGRLSKLVPAAMEGPSQASLLVSPDLQLRPYSGLNTPPASDIEGPTLMAGITNGIATDGASSDEPITNGAPAPQTSSRSRVVVHPIPGTTPYNLESNGAEDLQLLTPDEREVCNVLRLYPKAYIVLKENTLREALKTGGYMKKKAVRDICKIDTTKASRLFDFWASRGWIAKG